METLATQALCFLVYSLLEKKIMIAHEKEFIVIMEAAGYLMGALEELLHTAIPRLNELLGAGWCPNPSHNDIVTSLLNMITFSGGLFSSVHMNVNKG